VTVTALKSSIPTAPQILTPFQRTLRTVSRHRSAQIGFVLLMILVLTAIFADVIAPYPGTGAAAVLKGVKKRSPPCVHILGCPADQPEHIMGIDSNNRDLFSRIVYGTRVSLRIGLITTSLALVVGTLIGATSGFIGGIFDDIFMRLMDVLLAFPGLLLAIGIVTVLGPGLINALLALAIVGIPVYARLVRASVLSTKDLDFVTASRALGGSPLHVLVTRILPNSISPLIVQTSLGIAGAILSAAGLSFLGLGAEVGTPEWGLMLAEERSSVLNTPFLVFFPGIAIMLTVLSFNLLGDGLRDALDPRRKG